MMGTKNNSSGKMTPVLEHACLSASAPMCSGGAGKPEGPPWPCRQRQGNRNCHPERQWGWWAPCCAASPSTPGCPPSAARHAAFSGHATRSAVRLRALHAAVLSTSDDYDDGLPVANPLFRLGYEFDWVQNMCLDLRPACQMSQYVWLQKWVCSVAAVQHKCHFSAACWGTHASQGLLHQLLSECR